MQVWVWPLLGGASALILTAGAVLAQDAVTVTFSAERADPAAPMPEISWSATPLDLPADADIMAAMVFTPEPLTVPWQVALKPGTYLISGFSEQELYEATLVIGPDSTALTVPVLVVDAQVAFRCAEQEVCAAADQATGLAFDLPRGWAAEQPYLVDPQGGEAAGDVSAVFFEDIEGDGAAVWFLNPVEWMVHESGPCETVSLGEMCTFDLSDAAKRALEVIAPSLRREPVAP